MQTPVQATMPLTVTLEAQQWNQVIAAIAEAPYRVAAPLIQAMTEQLQAQASSEMSPGAHGNGFDTQPPPLMPTAVSDGPALPVKVPPVTE